MSGPQFLLHRRWASKDDSVVDLSVIRVQGTRRVQRPVLDVVDKRDVVAGVPVQRVKHRIKLHRVQELVYGRKHLEGTGKWSLRVSHHLRVPLFFLPLLHYAGHCSC